MIEIKHYAAYLPFELKVAVTLTSSGEYSIEKLVGINRQTLLIGGGKMDVLTFKLPDLRIRPILKPISNLLKDGQLREEYFHIFEDYTDEYEFYDDGTVEMVESCSNEPCYFHYPVVSKLLELHFDVFGFIENELALNVNNIVEPCPEFPFFGAIYPDARCVNGILMDLDKETINDDSPPCPFCNTEAFIEHHTDIDDKELADMKADKSLTPEEWKSILDSNMTKEDAKKLAETIIKRYRR